MNLFLPLSLLTFTWVFVVGHNNFDCSDSCVGQFGTLGYNSDYSCFLCDFFNNDYRIASTVVQDSKFVRCLKQTTFINHNEALKACYDGFRLCVIHKKAFLASEFVDDIQKLPFEKQKENILSDFFNELCQYRVLPKKFTEMDGSRVAVALNEDCVDYLKVMVLNAQEFSQVLSKTLPSALCGFLTKPMYDLIN
ncbi:hypothetical protein PCE1_001505 [Barthelona sp. PCE]